MTAKELNKAIRDYERAIEQVEYYKQVVESEKRYLNDPHYKTSAIKANIRTNTKQMEKYEAKVAEIGAMPEVTAELKAREEMVDNFADLINQLTEAWLDYYKNLFIDEQEQKAKRNEDRKNLTKSEFTNKHSYRYHYNFEEKIDVWTEKREEATRARSRQEAIYFLYDLRFRVMDYIGCITDYSELHCGLKSLEGFVRGTLGTAEVRSIWAGGYNIQRLHVRVLVHKVG